MAAYEVHGIGPWLWAGGLLGAFLTALYSFRLVFVVFFGEATTEPDRTAGWRMAGPLALLCILSIVGGYFSLPLEQVFPDGGEHHPSAAIIWISTLLPLLGIVLAYLVYMRRSLDVSGITESPGGKRLGEFWFSGWGIDWLYDTLFVRPYVGITAALRGEPVDGIYNAVVAVSRALNVMFSRTQTGRLRWYATSMVFGLILLIAIMAGVR